MTKKSSSSVSSGDQVMMMRSSDSDQFKFRGVRKRKWGKYVSEIRLPNSRERIWLGSYDSAEKAARAFDAAQFCLRGRGGNFNFPDSLPEIAPGRSMTPEEIQAAAARFANALPVEVAEETVSYSPSISEGSTVQMESEVSGVEESFYEELGLDTSTTVQMESEVSTGVEGSFYEGLRLATTALGSGNFMSEFGFLPGFDEFTMGTFFSPCPQQGNFDIGEDFYDASIYQDSSLWSF